jgi:TonB family protein
MRYSPSRNGAENLLLMGAVPWEPVPESKEASLKPFSAILLVLIAVPALADDPATVPPKNTPAGRVRFCDAYYPPDAKSAGIEGIAVLAVHIERDGAISKPHLIRSTGNTALDLATLKCAAMTFVMPVKSNGVPVAVDWRIRVRWSLTGQSFAMPDYVSGGTCAGLYPPISQRNSEEGVTIVRYRVGTDGSVSGVTVTRSSSFPRLDQATIECVSTWRYPVITRAGKPIEIERGVNMAWALH